MIGPESGNAVVLNRETHSSWGCAGSAKRVARLSLWTRQSAHRLADAIG